MDHSPPPFFKRGPAPLVRLFFFASLSLALLVIDARFRYAEGLRTWLALAAYPLQRAATAPVDLLATLGGFFSTQAHLVEENERLRSKALALSHDAQRYEAAQAEVEQLRKLVGVVDESDLLFRLQADPRHYGDTVAEAMTTSLETLAPGDSLQALRSVLDRGLVAIVADADGFHGLITRFDLLNHLRRQRTAS